MKLMAAIVLLGGAVATVAIISAVFSKDAPTPVAQRHASAAPKPIDTGYLRLCRALIWLLLPAVSIGCFFVAMKVSYRFDRDGPISHYIGLVLSLLCAVPPLTMLWWTGTLRQKINEAHRRATLSPTLLIPSRWSFF